MSEPTSDGPEPLYLDREVAEWLHRIANEYCGGDVSRAMNQGLRALMEAERKPDDPWAAISKLARARRGSYR